MPDRPIYLFKTARRPLYKKENLNLLAAERGTVHEYAWNRSWVAPELFDEGSIGRGRQVFFVLTERPFARFVPVRDGEVVSAHWDETLLRVKVLLNNPVGVEEVDLATFTHLAKETSRSNAPPEKFVVPKSDGVAFRVFYDDREIPGWRKTVDEVLAMSRESENDPYARSVFFRPGGVRCEDGELLPTRRIAMEPGTTGSMLLHFHNPHLTREQLDSLSLELHASGGFRIDPVPTIPGSDDVEVSFEALDGPDPELRIEVSPAPAQHTWVLQRLARTGKEHRVQVESPDEESRVSRDRLRKLYRMVLRKAALTPDDELDVLDAFHELLPEEHEIAERKAMILLGEGRAEEAYERLSELNREVLGDDARRFLFRQTLLRSPNEEPFNVVESLELTSEGRFGLLVEEMRELPASTLDRLVPSLVGHLPEPAQRQRVIDQFGSRLTTPAAARETALNLYWADEGSAAAERAFRYLARMRLELGSNDRALVDALIELAEAGGEDRFDHDLRRVIEMHVTNLIERDRFDESLVQLRKASSSLGRFERRKLFHLVADRFKRKERWEDASRTMIELAWHSEAHGHLTDATEAVERARGLWARAGHGSPSDELRDVVEQVSAAWEDMSDLVEWRKADEERRRERLRARLLNRAILVAGGKKNPEWIEHLADLTGAEIDWCEAWRDETDDLDAYAERIQNGRYEVVLHYHQKTGHQTGDVLRPACESAGVPFLKTTTAGRRGLAEALDGLG